MQKINAPHVTVDIGGETYRLENNLNVLESICVRYGGLDEFRINLTSMATAFGAVKFVLAVMINEGIEIDNETADDQREPVTEKWIGRNLGLASMSDLPTAIFAALNQGLPEPDGNEKNSEAAQTQ